MLMAGFDNLAGHALGNFDCLGDAAPLRYQSRNVGTRAEIASFFERLDSDADRNFFNFRDMLLPFHARLSCVILTQSARLPLLPRRRLPPAIPRQARHPPTISDSWMCAVQDRIFNHRFGLSAAGILARMPRIL